MEIWQIKIECSSEWQLEGTSEKFCEIQNTYQLIDLCAFILDSFNFDNAHMHEFFISKEDTQNQGSIIANENITLYEVYPIEKNNYLFMRFDDDWLFKITGEFKGVEFVKKNVYPRVKEHVGKNPVQYPMYEEYD